MALPSENDRLHAATGHSAERLEALLARSPAGVAALSDDEIEEGDRNMRHIVAIAPRLVAAGFDLADALAAADAWAAGKSTR